MKSYLTILAWLIVFVVFGLACEPADSAETDANTVDTNATAEKTAKGVDLTNVPAKTRADSVAVTVNGVAITEAAVDAEVAMQLRTTKIPPQMPPAIIEQYKKQLRRPALERLIGMVLLDEAVKASNIVVTEEEVIDQVKRIASREGLSLDDFKALLQAYGKTFDEWKQEMQFRKRLGYQKLMEAQFAGKINITEDDAKKYYSENKKQFETTEQVRASHILIKPDTTDPNADPNELKAKAKAKAEDLLKQIKGGADFATLARANSGCSSATGGGDLGFFRRNQMVPSFSKASFELKVGQVSEIVETRFGYHIIKATGRKSAGVISFEQAKDDIINELTQKKRQELANQYIESLKAKAKANIVYPAGKEPKKPGPPTRKAPPGFKSTAEPEDKTAVK